MMTNNAENIGDREWLERSAQVRERRSDGARRADRFVERARPGSVDRREHRGIGRTPCRQSEPERRSGLAAGDAVEVNRGPAGHSIRIHEGAETIIEDAARFVVDGGEPLLVSEIEIMNRRAERHPRRHRTPTLPRSRCDLAFEDQRDRREQRAMRPRASGATRRRIGASSPTGSPSLRRSTRAGPRIGVC